jgi:exosortase H (IPTLxxWG-CTERM-specific)
MLAPFARPAVAGVTTLVVESSAFLIRLFGGYASANGDLLVGSSSAHVIRVANGCNGLHVGVLLWAAIAAFPAPLAKKAKGFALTTAALYATNLVRVVSLFYLEPHGGTWFDLAHLYLWESLIVIGAFTVFWLWARGAYPAVSEARRLNG